MNDLLKPSESPLLAREWITLLLQFRRCCCLYILASLKSEFYSHPCKAWPHITVWAIIVHCCNIWNSRNKLTIQPGFDVLQFHFTITTHHNDLRLSLKKVSTSRSASVALVNWWLVRIRLWRDWIRVDKSGSDCGEDWWGSAWREDWSGWEWIRWNQFRFFVWSQLQLLLLIILLASCSQADQMFQRVYL